MGIRGLRGTLPAASLTLALIAGFAPSVKAQCVPSGSTVNCSGTVLNGSGTNGYGTGAETGLTINVTPSTTTVTGDANGIEVGATNIITNSGTVTGNGATSFATAGVLIGTGSTVNNTGTVQGNGLSSGIHYTGSVTVNNLGAGSLITGVGSGISPVSGDPTATINVTNQGTISSTIGDAIDANVTATVNNSGNLIGGGSGTFTVQAPTIFLTNSGSMSGSDYGAFGNDVTVTNTANGNINASVAGIQANNSVSGSNAGTITGGFDGIAVSLGTINFTNSGTITGQTGSGIESIQPGSTLTITNTSTGNISGSGFGIFGSTISLANAGIISAAPGLGSWGVLAGTKLNLTNAGTGVISGDTGVEADLGGSTIFTAGTITGFFGTAIVLGGGGNTLTLGPGFVNNGNVLGSGSDIFQLGGTGTGGFNLSAIGTQYTGFSTFNVVGGTWQATGSNGNNWTISGGNLQVGPDASPNASITGTVSLTGGALSGLGTIGNIVNTAGTVMPGGSIGTLSVTGNYTQAAAGTLAIEVSPSAASLLKVGGAARLAGTLALVYDPGVYTTHAYTIVSASSVAGTFPTVVGNTPSNVTQAIVSDPADVMLQLTGTGTTTPATPFVVAPTNDTIYTALTSTLVFKAQQANSIILDRVGNRSSGIADGEVALGGVAPSVLQYAQTGNGAVIGDLASALPQALASQGAWFRGIGGFASVDGRGAIPGFSGTAGGFLTGFDRPVAENVYLGLAGGYLHSTVDERSTSRGGADTARVAVYGGAFLGPSLLTATAGYAHDWIDTQRGLALGTAVESHSGNEATVAGQWSLPLQVQGLGQGIATLTPKAGFQFLHLGESGFSETGAGGLNLSSASRGTDSFQPFVALAASQKFLTADGTLITPEVRLGYDREALSGARTLTVATVGGAQFPVTGIKPSRNIATAGAGLTLQAGPALSLYATYDAVLPTANTTDQTVQAGLRIRF